MLSDLVVNSGEIEFKNVSFTYPVQRGEKENKRALTDVSFKIKANSKVAIVGDSGAGKSTIFQLITRFYDPDLGAVFVDGQGLFSFPFPCFSRLQKIGHQFWISLLKGLH